MSRIRLSLNSAIAALLLANALTSPAQAKPSWVGCGFQDVLARANALINRSQDRVRALAETARAALTPHLRFLETKAAKVRDSGQLTELIQDAKLAQVSEEKGIALIRTSPYVRELKIPPQALTQFARRSWISGEADTKYLFTFSAAHDARLAKKYQGIRSHEEFSNLFYRLWRNRLSAYRGLEILEQTEYVRHFAIDRDSLERLWLAMERADRKSRVSKAGVAAAVKQEFPALGSGLKSWNSKFGYDRELPGTPILDQCQSGTCWLQTGTTMKDHRIRQVLGKPYKISAEYPYLWDIRSRFYQWLERYPSELRNPDWSFFSGPLREQGNFSDSHALDRAFGVLPEAVWKAKRNPFDPDTYRHMLDFMEGLLRDYGAQLRAGGVDPRQKKLIFDRFSKYVDSQFGELPDPDGFKFQMDQKSYTPKEFFKSHFSGTRIHFIREGEAQEKAARLSKVIPARDFSTHAIDTHPQLMEALPIEKIEEVIRSHLDQDRPIFLVYHSGHAEAGLDQSNGILKIRPPKGESRNSGHAVTVVGYELDLHGRIRSLKVQNSYGTRSGDQGYYHMSGEFFRRFLKSISFLDP